MFIGHFGFGLAAKKLDARPSLGTFFLAAQFVDLLWPFFLLAGIEKVKVEPGNTAFTPLNFISYPYTHSLVAVFLWAILFGVIYYLIRRKGRGALLLSLLVISHWLLDLVTHRPDLPLSFSEETKVGFGLWNAKLATICIEVLLFAFGTFLYTKTMVSINKQGNYGFWGLILFLLIIYFMNAFGPPPENEQFIGIVGLAQWILIVWGYWIDRNRKSVENIAI